MAALGVAPSIDDIAKRGLDVFWRVLLLAVLFMILERATLTN